MIRLLFPATLVVSLLAHVGAFGQLPGTRKVCVVARDTGFGHAVNHQVNSSPELRTQRDLVVKYLNQPSTNSQMKLEAVALISTNSETILSDAGKTGCNFIVALIINHPAVDESEYRQKETQAETSGVIDPDFPQPAPIAFTILRPKASNLWVSLPSGNYNPYKWSAKDIATEVHKTILKNPSP